MFAIRLGGVGPKNINIALASVSKLVRTMGPKSQKRSAPNSLKIPIEILVLRKSIRDLCQNQIYCRNVSSI